MSKPEKTARRFRPAKPLVICAVAALSGFLAVSPPAGSLDAAEPPSRAPSGEAGGTVPQRASGEPDAPATASQKPDAGGAPAGEAPSGKPPAAEPPAGPAVTGPGSPAGPGRAGAVPARVPVPAAEKEKASTVLRAYVDKAASTLAAAKTPSADELKALAVGPAQGAVLADAAEFENNGWHQEGVPTVEELEIVGFDAAASPQRMTVNACIDSSKVKVVTAAGQTIREGTSSSRSLNILSLVRAESGEWLVEQVTFPDDPTC